MPATATISQFILESLWAILSLSAMGLFWHWSLAGWRRLAHGPSAHVFRRRNLAVTVGLGPCFLLTLLALPAVGWFSPYVTALLAAVAFCTHAAMDPSKNGFWHHLRLKIGRAHV